MNISVSDNKYFLKYGLEKDPFPPNAVDENIYLTPEINRRLKQARQHIAAGQKLLLVVSAPGAGKSLLARKLVILKEPNWRISLISVDSDMKSDTLACKVVQQLLPEENIDISLSISMLHKYLEQSYRDNTLPVVLIDNADQLSFDTLQFILQLADLRYNDSLFRIILFADGSIIESFEKTGLKELSEGVLDILSMPYFSREQLRAYLQFRLSSCGKDIEFPYTDGDIEYLYRASAGLPGGINILARQLMQQAIKKENAGGRVGTMAAVCIVLVAILSAYLFIENRSMKNTAASSVAELRPALPATTEKEKVLQDPVPANVYSSAGKERISDLNISLSLKLSDVLANMAEDQAASP